MSIRIINKTLSMFLAIMLLFSAVPVAVFAEETNTAVVNGVTISADGNGSLKEDGGAVTVTVQGKSTLAITASITVQNTTGSAASISFNYEASDYDENGWTLSGEAIGANGTYEGTLDAGDSLTFQLVAPKRNTATVVLSDFQVSALSSDATITIVYDKTMGSVSAGGEQGQNGELVVENVGAGGLTMTATPAAGMTFAGWVEVSTSKLLSTDLEYTHVPTGDTTIRAAFFEPQSAAQFQVGNEMYSDLNAAITAAVNGSNKTITLAASGALPAGDYVIPADVVLQIPHDSKKTLCTETPVIVEETPTETPSAYCTLTMKPGASLNIEGALSVGGTMTSKTFPGHVYGKYGHIEMESGSTISIENEAFLYAWGFISGSGNVTVKDGGTVYENFQTLGWRGGNTFSSVNDNRDTYKLFPLSQFYIQNVEVPMTFYPGASEFVYFAADSSYGTFGTTIAFIGSDDGWLRVKNGTLVKDYNESTDYMDFTITGTTEIHSIFITVSAMGSTETMDSAYFHTPLPNHFKIDLKYGAMLDIKNDLSLLPGSELNISEGASVRVASGKSLVVYDLDEWSTKQEYKYNNNETVPVGSGFVFIGDGDRHIRPVYYTTSRGTSSPRGTTAENLKDAKVCVDGTLDAANAYLYTTVGGADICSRGNGKIIFGAANASGIAEYQMLQGGYENKNVIYVKIDTIPAKLKNATGEYTETSGAQTLYYNNGAWGSTPAEVFSAQVVWKDGSAATDFYSVQGAIDAATHAGDTVVLLADAVLQHTLVVGEAYDLVLDLNGHTISNATASVLDNYGSVLVTDSSEGGVLVSTQLIDVAPASKYRYACTVQNHGVIELQNVSIRTHTSGYRIGLLNYPGGTVVDIDQAYFESTGTNGHAIYNLGHVDQISSVEIVAYYGYVAHGEESYTGMIGSQDSTVLINSSNMAIWVRDGAVIDVIGASGSKIYIDKGRTENNDGSVTQTMGNTGIYVSSGSFINKVGNTGSEIYLSENTAFYATGSAESIGTIDILGNGGSIYITGGENSNGIYAEEGGTINTIGNGGVIDISDVKHGIYVKNAGVVGTIGNDGSTITIDVSSYGIATMGVDYESRIGTIGNGGSIKVNAGAIGICINNNGNSVGKIATSGTVVLVAETNNAIHMGSGSTVQEIGAGLTAITLTDQKYALRISGASNNIPAASVALISGGYFYTPAAGNRGYAIDKYASQTYPENHTLKRTPVVVSVDGVDYKAFAVERVYTFDGMTPDTTVLAPNTVLNVLPVTVEAWINIPADFTDRPGIIWGSYPGGTGKYISFEVVQTNGSPKLQFFTGSGSTIMLAFDNVDVRTGEWLHLAITYDNGKAYCYINGRLAQTINAATTALSGALPTKKPMALGGDFRNGNGVYFKGKIASLAVYTDMRSAQEILADMTAPGTDDLLVHYEVNSATNGIVVDLSGNGYDIGICDHNYTVTFDWADDYMSAEAIYECSLCNETNRKQCEVVSLAGRYGAYVTIEGIAYSDYHFDLGSGKKFGKNEVLTTDKTLDQVPHTFEAWIKLAADTGRGIILGSYEGTGGKKYISFEIHNNGNPRLCWHCGTAAPSVIFNEVDVRTGEWLHLAITINGSSASCYINGVCVQTMDVANGTTLGNALPLAANLALGNDHRPANKYNFPGEIASVAVYTDVRTAEEIKKDMVAPEQSDLLIHYEVNGTTGNQINDLSGNGYHIIGNCDHNYTVTFDWADDYSSATATAVCSLCLEGYDGYRVIENCDISELPNRGYRATVTIAEKTYTDAKYIMDGMSFTSDYIYAPSKSLSESPLTIEAWVNLPQGGTREVVIWGSYPGGYGKFINLSVQANGYPRLCWSDNASASASTGDIKFTNGNVRTGEWVHIAIVYDASANAATYYLNGVLQQICSNSKSTFLTNVGTVTKKMVLGGDYSTGQIKWFDGKIASVAAYSNARDALTIQADMLNPGRDNLIVYYELDAKTSGGMIEDLSGNGYDIVDPWVEGNEPNDYAYSFVVIGDTQKAVELHPDDFHKIYDYVLDHIDDKKIKFVFGLGDIVDYNIKTEPGLTAEWEIAAEQIKRMNGKVPYSIIRGNHDEIASFNKYFPVADYADVIGGYYQDMRNTWQAFEVNGIKYLVVNLDFGPTDDMVQWANDVITQHPDHNVIVTTHSYLYHDGSTLDYEDNASPGKCYEEWGYEGGTYHNGNELWNNLIKKHENIVMVLSGHDPYHRIVYTPQQGDHGNTVMQMLIDPQQLDVDVVGGVGMVSTFYISENGRDVTVDYYSTFHEKYYLAENQFAITLDVHSWVETDSREATCDAAGYTIYSCSSCGNTHTKTIEIPALGHTPGAEATCTTAQSCTVCSAELVAALGHYYIDHESKEPTCEEIGWNAYQTCSRCDFNTYAERSALGHTEETIPGKAATCTEAGLTDGMRCIVCGDVTVAQEQIGATGHSYGEAVDNVKECTACGDKRFVGDLHEVYYVQDFLYFNATIPMGNAPESVKFLTQDGETELPEFGFAYDSSKKLLYITRMLPSDEIAQTYQFVISIDGALTDVFEVDFTSYAGDLDAEHKHKTVADAIVRYGIASNGYFNAKEDIAEVTAEPNAQLKNDNAIISGITATDEAVFDTYAASLLFDERIALKIYFSGNYEFDTENYEYQMGILRGEAGCGEMTVTLANNGGCKAIIAYNTLSGANVQGNLLGQVDLAKYPAVVFNLNSTEYCDRFAIRAFLVIKDKQNGMTTVYYGKQVNYGMEDYIGRMLDVSEYALKETYKVEYTKAFRQFLIEAWNYALAADETKW